MLNKEMMKGEERKNEREAQEKNANGKQKQTRKKEKGLIEPYSRSLVWIKFYKSLPVIIFTIR
jgi:hypothetical protein